MPPTKLAHLVYQTNRMAEMRDWYCTVLGARVIYERFRAGVPVAKLVVRD